MRRYRLYLLLILFLSLTYTFPALAKVDWEIQKTLKFKGAPIDMVSSPNGIYLFVLTDDGTLHIYSSSGTLKGRINVGRQFDTIAAGPGEEIVFLKSTKEKSVQRVSIDFIYDFNFQDSPFKGNAEAPVSVVVFSDYQ